IDSWPGKKIHSHNYRVPDQFKDQVVIVIGSSASGVDICRDIAKVAKEVHVSSRSTSPETYEKLPGYDNLWLHSTIEIAREDGSVVFENGKTVFADTIMHCTGNQFSRFLFSGEIFDAASPATRRYSPVSALTLLLTEFSSPAVMLPFLFSVDSSSRLASSLYFPVTLFSIVSPVTRSSPMCLLFVSGGN
ncbi:unnamed protein product, partial [Arabidopsis halleri]